MNKQSIFWGFLSLLWVFTGSWYVGNLIGLTNEYLPILELQDDEIKFQSDDHFMFGLSSDQLKMGESSGKFFEEIAKYLKDNPGKILELNGFYLAEELNHSEYPNLGEARAIEVKKALVEMGVDEKNLLIKSEELAKNPMLDNVLYDGVGLKLLALEEVREKREFDASDENGKMAVEYVEPMALYGDAIFELDLNPSMQHYIDKIAAYLGENKEASLHIVGHTQELGSIVKNADRSMEMARKVRRFFRNNGISGNRIKAKAKGATEPILAPHFPKAERKNNRVEIMILEE